MLGPLSVEIPDPDLLEIPVASYDLYVTSERIAGKSLQQLADGLKQARGVLFRGISRGGRDLPVGANVIVERGIRCRSSGRRSMWKNCPVVGRKIYPHEDSDLGLGIAIAVGVFAGAAITIPLGGMRITLGTSVGTLLAGLTVGWARSTRPWFARFPTGLSSSCVHWGWRHSWPWSALRRGRYSSAQ